MQNDNNNVTVCKIHKMPKFIFYYGKDGKELCCLVSWGKKFEDKEYKTIKQTKINGKFISTIWLGLDHGFAGGEPLIFETMVFSEGSWLDEECKRYSTIEEAKKGHEEFFKKYS